MFARFLHTSKELVSLWFPGRSLHTLWSGGREALAGAIGWSQEESESGTRDSFGLVNRALMMAVIDFNGLILIAKKNIQT